MCVRVRVHVCVCVCVCALREDVNVVMNQEKTLVIGAIDRNHLMSVLGAAAKQEQKEGVIVGKMPESR